MILSIWLFFQDLLSLNYEDSVDLVMAVQSEAVSPKLSDDE